MAARAVLGDITAAGAPPAGKGGKTIEQIYQKKSQLEHILLRPDSYGERRVRRCAAPYTSRAAASAAAAHRRSHCPPPAPARLQSAPSRR